MKKLLSLILALAMIFCLCACGEGSTSASGSSATNDSSSGIKAPSSISTASPDTAETTSAEPAEKEAKSDGLTIEEAVIFDQGDIKITAKSIDTDGMFGPEIKLLIENNSSTDITVQSRNASVNGYMIETMLSADVAAGKKVNDELVFMNSDLETAGISTIADVEFSFHIFNSDTWDTIIDSDMISIQTSAAANYEYTFDDSGFLVYDDNGVQIVVKGLSETDSWLGPEIIVYMSNTGTRNATIQVRDVSVNGFMVETIFSSDIIPGKHAIPILLMSVSL